MIFDWIDEHKKLSVLTFIIIVLGFPLLVNQLSVWEAKCDVFGYPSDWLSFWGTYLAAIASLSMIIITAISIRNNLIENEKNRKNNKYENEQNRTLQLNILTYQQEQEWLNRFRKSAVEYVMLYSYNDLVDVANVAKKDPYKAFYLIKDLFTRAGKADLNLAFIQKQDESFKNLDDDKTKFFIFYNSVLYDIQSLLCIRIDSLEKKLQDALLLNEISDDMRKIVKDIITEFPYESIENQFNTAIMIRIKVIEKCEENLRNRFCEYIQNEQKRINNILCKK